MNHPLGGEYLVVEGWMNRRQLSASADVFRNHGYRELVVTGGPIAEDSYMRLLYPDFKSMAEVGTKQLRSPGVSPVHTLPRPAVAKDRTYSSALALRKWLTESGQKNVRVDIVSSGPHSRRSQMLFRLALGGVADVGVISVKPQGYDPGRWWKTSAGVRTMIGELIAYGYAKFLFYPDPERDLKILFPEGES
jgi:hypothetical protein